MRGAWSFGEIDVRTEARIGRVGYELWAGPVWKVRLGQRRIAIARLSFVKAWKARERVMARERADAEEHEAGLNAV